VRSDVAETDTEAQAVPQAPDGRQARRAGRLVGLGVVIAVTLAFTAASAYQIVTSALELPVRPLPGAPSGEAESICAEGIRSLTNELPAFDESDRDQPPRLAKSASFIASVEISCAHSTEGLDAWASFLRFEEATKQLPGGSREELTVLRRNVYAHLPAELR
jgi:hypothetical protein